MLCMNSIKLSIFVSLCACLFWAGARAQEKSNLQPAKKNMIEIEIWSDIMCPFCYIGKRNFETALQNFSQRSDVVIRWKSYLLDPELVTDSTKSIHQHLAQSKGWTLEYAKEMGDYVSNMAKEAGLNYDMNRIKVANTFNAHRLIQLAKQSGKANELEELLFKAYFTEGKNLDDSNVLLNLGEAAGLEGARVKDLLNSKSFSEDVWNDLKEAETIGVGGVPFFVFNRSFAVSGAQSSETFLNALNKVLESK